MINDTELVLKPTTIADLKHLFQFQLDEEARYMAAFMSKDSTDETAYLNKMSPLLSNPTVNNQTIFVNDRIVGSIAKFIMDGDAEITYWIDKAYWGKGIATKMLQRFLSIETTRPIWGRAASDNIGSQRVLENCGFEKVGTDSGFASVRGREIEEVIYKLV